MVFVKEAIMKLGHWYVRSWYGWWCDAAPNGCIKRPNSKISYKATVCQAGFLNRERERDLRVPWRGLSTFRWYFYHTSSMFSGSLNVELMFERFCPFNKLLLIASPWSFCSSHVTGNMFSLVVLLLKIHIKIHNDELTIKILTPDWKSVGDLTDLTIKMR